MAFGLATLTASAHAPPLAARVLSPDEGHEVIVTNRGLVFREPATGRARLLCNEALRINTSELPNVALLGDSGLLVATSSGLRLSRDQGCSWSDVAHMEATNTSALAADPNDGDSVVIASYDGDVPGLRSTHDAGASWTLLYPTEPDEYVHSLLVAAADSATLYATVASYAPGVAPVHSLLRTRDGGASWQRIELPLTEKDYLARAAAVSPSDPALLVLYTVANSPGLDDSRLLISRDAGDTFSVALERPEIRGAGYGADGKLWVAARDGLYGAGADLRVFAQTSIASELGCVLERAGDLLVCGHYAGLGSASSGIGISADGGSSFERWLDFASVDAAIECPAGSPTSVLCAKPWLDWQAEISGVLPTTPLGAYGPVGTPGAIPVAMAALDPAEPAGDALAPAVPEGERGTDEAQAATCALRPPAQSGAGGGTAALGWLAAGLAPAWWLRRHSRGAR
ncbi:MAG: hypothetical protein ABI895_23060 [Deltaproteobacteria bacterium]